jgi:hypothetical protein
LPVNPHGPADLSARFARILAAGNTGQGPSEALHRAGRWSMIFERDSDGWKVRLLIANVTPPSPPRTTPETSK